MVSGRHSTIRSRWLFWPAQEYRANRRPTDHLRTVFPYARSEIRTFMLAWHATMRSSTNRMRVRHISLAIKFGGAGNRSNAMRISARNLTFHPTARMAGWTLATKPDWHPITRTRPPRPLRCNLRTSNSVSCASRPEQSRARRQLTALMANCRARWWPELK